MTRGTTALGVGAIGAAAIGGAVMYTDSTGGAPQFNDPMAINALDANPRIINEGDTVWFVVDVAEGVPNITWHFDDGSPPASGLDLKTYEHRFIDDAEEPYDVRVEAGGASESVEIRVNNVAPTIEHATYIRPAVAGSPVDFTASATDPGQADELTYTWDFGGGDPATGQQAQHTFPADGAYPVELTVTDGDGGEATRTLTVVVGEGGWFEISGGASVPRTTAEMIRFIGTRSGNGASARCSLRIDLQSGDATSGVTLTAAPPLGLSAIDYIVGRSTEWDGMYRDEAANPFYFYVEAHLPRSQALRVMANGQTVGGPFWSEGGGLSVTYFDGAYLELSFEATVRENIPPSFGPRRLTVRGGLARRIGGAGVTGIFSALTTGSTTVYTCDQAGEAFAITSREPDASAINVPLEHQPVRVTFERPIDPSTIPGNAKLTYRGASGSAVTVEGSWQAAGDARQLEFVPQSRLRAGVIHCLSLRAGPDGLRGRDGEVLEPAPPSFPPLHAEACEPIGPFPLAVDWSFATQVDVESLRVDMYQASQAGQGAPLIPSKPTVARVYAHWRPDDAVHDTAQVKQFPAQVSVQVNAARVYPPRLGYVRRPDQITPEQARNGGASSNLFGWRPSVTAGASSVVGVVEPVDELFTPKGEVRSPAASLPGSSGANVIEWQPYVLELPGVCPAPDAECYPGWRDGVDAESAVTITALLDSAGLVATQNFPVTEAYAVPLEVITPVDMPRLVPCMNDALWHCYEISPGVQVPARQHLAEMLAFLGQNSTADVLVGIVPPETGSYWGAINITDEAGRRAVLIEADEDPHVFVHEIGHAYGLRHCPVTGDFETPCADPVIRGFAMDLTGDYGFNKHDVEGNQQSQTLAPLMHETPGMFDPADVFISTSDYRILSADLYGLGTQGRLDRGPMFANPITRLARALLPVPLFAQDAGPDGRLTVTGVISDRGVLLRRVSHDPHGRLPDPARPTPGDLTLDLLDASGSVLESIPFGVPAVDQPRGVARSFVVSVPAPAGLHAIRVSAPGHDPAERARSTQPPRLEPGAVETTAGGDRTINWTVIDADQDDVTVSVFVRSEATAGWQGVARSITTGGVTIRASQLPPGPQVRGRLVADDGFNTSMAEMDIGPGAPLQASPLRPADGSERVAQNADVVARVSSPLAAPRTDRPVRLQAGSFTLVDPDGNEVFADVTYQPRRGLLILSPIRPLQQGTRYTATIAGLEDRWGGPLAAPVTWSFETIGRIPPRGRGGR